MPIRLPVKLEPFEIELAEGITLTVKPLTTLSHCIAAAKAEHKLKELEAGQQAVEESGLYPELEKADFTDPEWRAAFFQTFMIRALAERQIIAWTGVVTAPDDSPAELSPENIHALMSKWDFGQRFLNRLTAHNLEMMAGRPPEEGQQKNEQEPDLTA